MNLWIKICVSFFFFLETAIACSLTSKEVISLSGPVTTYLDQLGIVEQLEGISSFNPVKNYSGKKFAGGLYLSTGTLKGMEGKLVFYDKSRELKKVLDRFPKIKIIELDSRRKSPAEVIELTEKVLAPYLKNCQEKTKDLNTRAAELEKKIKTNIGKIKNSIFFLGRIGEKLPETVLSNDGFVYWLRQEKLISSYPSDLEYVNWSMKVLSPLRENYYFFGLENTYQNGDKKVQKISGKVFNVRYPGALTPGYTQLEFMDFLLNQF